MKTIPVVCCLSLISLICSAQTSVTVARFTNGSAYIEAKHLGTDRGGKYYPKEALFHSELEYWVTTPTNISIQAAMKKALSWAKLNVAHQKSFEKELFRFRVTRKDTYVAYRNYISQFSDEAKATFVGYEDGTFSLVFTVSNAVAVIDWFSLEDEEAVQNFINILQGKSANREIDDIFY